MSSRYFMAPPFGMVASETNGRRPKGQLTLRRQRARVARAAVDPFGELTLRTHAVGLDAEPALHLPAAHLHRAGVRRRDELVRLLRIDANEDPALPARPDGHVAADQEGEPAEHLLLRQAGLVAKQLPDALRELLVVRHGGDASAATDRRSRDCSRASGSTRRRAARGGADPTR